MSNRCDMPSTAHAPDVRAVATDASTGIGEAAVNSTETTSHTRGDKNVTHSYSEALNELLLKQVRSKVDKSPISSAPQTANLENSNSLNASYLEKISTQTQMKQNKEFLSSPPTKESSVGTSEKLNVTPKSLQSRSLTNLPQILYGSAKKNTNNLNDAFSPRKGDNIKAFGANLQMSSISPEPVSNQDRVKYTIRRDPPSEDVIQTPIDISDLILKLNSEIGYDKLWKNLVATLQGEFLAQGASLSLPNDATDLINTPWGLKAVWRIDEGSAFSDKSGYDSKGQSSPKSPFSSSQKDEPNSTVLNRNLSSVEISSVEISSSFETSKLNRHSTNSDDDWDDTFEESIPRRKTKLSQEHMKNTPDLYTDDGLNFESKSDIFTVDSVRERPINASNTRYTATKGLQTENKPEMKPKLKNIELFAKLARLDSESESLIDNDGVVTVLERGTVNLLQRRYYNSNAEPSAQTTRNRTYFDAEQVTLSPWLKSPVPSPAMPTPNERNPFFTAMEKHERLSNLADEVVNEEKKACGLTEALRCAFRISDSTTNLESDPSGSNSSNSSLSSVSEVYDPKTVVNSIEFDSNTKSVIHLPLFHPDKDRTIGDFFNKKQAPIAIISIVSTMIPYDPELLELLVKFGPHIATAISQAQAHTNLLHQIDMMSSNYSTPLLSAMSNIRKVPPFPRGRSFSHHYHSSAPISLTSLRPAKQQFTHTKSKSIQWPIRHNDKSSKIFLEEKQDLEKDWTERKLYVPLGGGVERYIRVGEFGNDTSIDVNSSGETQRKENTGEISSKKLNVSNENVVREAKLPSPPPEINNLKAKTSRYSRIKARYARRTRSFLHSQGASFLTASEVASNPPSDEESDYATKIKKNYRPANPKTLPLRPTSPSLTNSIHSNKKSHFRTPSTKLLRTMIDSIPVQVYTAEPGTGRITWVSNRTLAYRGQSKEDFYRNSNKSIHEDDRKTYETEWNHCIRTGESMNMMLKLKRFDGRYRVFYVRAVPLKDERGVIVHWFGTCTDIHDKRKAEVEATRQAHEAASDHKYKILAESSPIIVFAADPTKGIVYSNAKWFAYSGRSVADTIGLGFLEFVHPEDRALCLLPKNPGNKESPGISFHPDNGIYSFELRLRNKNDDYRWHLVRVKSADTDNFANGLWFGTCTDINDQKLIQEKLQEAKDNAQKIIESKSRFLSNMSHEIRTPLIGISGMVSFLLDTSLTAEQLDYCHTISSSSEALLMVINDILDISKVESGKMTLNPEWFHVRTVIDEAIELLSSMFISKNLEVNYIVDKNVPIWIEGDRIRIRQVLLNIIGNAIKFTDEGEIFVSCKRAEIISNNGVIPENLNTIDLKFEVHDTGRGFTKKDEQLMFKPFSQVCETHNRTDTFLPNSQNQDNRGTGLGLVISQQLVQLHGGDLTCSSVENVGSTFYFNFKVKVASETYHPSMLDGSKVMKNVRGTGAVHKNAVLTRSQSTKAFRNACITPNLTPSDDPSTEDIPQLMRSKSENRFLFMNPNKREINGREFENKHSEKLKKDSSSDMLKSVSSFKMNILVICPHKFSTQSIRHNIESVMPRSIADSCMMVDCPDVKSALIKLSTQSLENWWTHIVINLINKDDVSFLVNEIISRHDLEMKYKDTQILLLTTMALRSELSRGLYEVEKDLNRIGFIFKPLKPSKFLHIFDPCTGKLDSQDMRLINAHETSSNQNNVFSSIRSNVGDKKLRILLVEDNLVNQKVLSKYFSKVGLESITATDGEDCLKKLFGSTPLKPQSEISDEDGHSLINKTLLSTEKCSNTDYEHCPDTLNSEMAAYKQFDLILCDLDMPRKNGFQTCKEIRNWEKEHDIHDNLLPVIALSAYVMSDVAEKCREAGFTSYISKPVDFKVLKNKLVEALGKKIALPIARNNSY